MAAPVAQGQSLPATVVSAQPLTSQDQQAVQRFVQPLLENLTSSNHVTAQGARDRLIEPVRGETSVSFRIYYSQLVMPWLQRMVGPQADPQRSQLAMTVAAYLATDAARTLLVGQLDDPRATVRYGAARELAVLIENIDAGQGRSAVQQDALDGFFNQLRQAIANEEEMLVATALASALAKPTVNQSLQDAALTAMCAGMAEQIKMRANEAPDAAEPYELIVATLRTMRDANARLINRQIAGGAPAPLNRAAADFASAVKEFSAAIDDHPALDANGEVLAGRLEAAADNLLQITSGLGG